MLNGVSEDGKNMLNRVEEEQAVKAIIDRLLKTKRPKPSLSMVPSNPFTRGSSQVLGYQAVVQSRFCPTCTSGGRHLNSEDCAAKKPNPEYGSPEWYSTQKLYITSWGRAYAGPLAHNFWVESVDRRASGLPAKRKKAEHTLVQSDTSESATPPAIKEDDHAGETPLPVGMKGSVLVFGFVLCSWSVEFGREIIYDDEGHIAKQICGPMFSLHPVGPKFRWYITSKCRREFSHPRRCLEHLAQWYVRMYACMHACMYIRD
jgi:hypothetical protein